MDVFARSEIHFATARRARTLLALFSARFDHDPGQREQWSELGETLATLERAAVEARDWTAEWLSKAALARREACPDLADDAERRAAAAEQEFAAYLTEIAAIWAFLENGAQEPLPAPVSSGAAAGPGPGASS
jgi:hypothetical protein